MINHYYTLDDAIVYFTNRVAKTTVKEYYEALASKHPELKKQLEQILAPSLELERLLDAAIPNMDQECEFFFGLDRSTEGNSQPLWNAAGMLLGYSAGLSLSPQSLDEAIEKRLALSPAQKDKLFLSYMFDLEDTGVKARLADAGKKGCITEALSVSRLNSLTRIKLHELYDHFDEHIKRLAELLRPAVETIEKSTAVYEAAALEQASRFEAAGGLAAYMISNHSFHLNDTGSHLAHISVLAPHTVNIRDGIFDSMDIYVGVGVVELSRILLQGSESEHLSAMFKLLSDATRLEMLKCISERPMYGQELVEKFSVTAPTVSYHMTKLVLSGLAESYFEGGKSYFRANMKGILALEKSFRDYFATNTKR